MESSVEPVRTQNQRLDDKVFEMAERMGGHAARLDAHERDIRSMSEAMVARDARIDARLSEITRKLDSMPQAQPVDHGSLAMQRTLDFLDRRFPEARTSGASVVPWLLLGAAGVVIVALVFGIKIGG